MEDLKIRNARWILTLCILFATSVLVKANNNSTIISTTGDPVEASNFTTTTEAFGGRFLDEDNLDNDESWKIPEAVPNTTNITTTTSKPEERVVVPVPEPKVAMSPPQLDQFMSQDVDCTNLELFKNSTPVNIADMEFYAQSLRTIDQLHHTDRCDPDLDDRIHSTLWTLEKNHVLTFGRLFLLSCGMKQTCPGGRHMICDPTRKRCVCKPNSMWLRLSAAERLDPELNSNQGRCYLKVGSKCEDSRHISKKMERLTCVENSQCLSVKDKSSGKMIKQCHCPLIYKRTLPNKTIVPKINQTCWNAVYSQDLQLQALMKRASKMKWKSFGESCTSESAIDTRIHTLRSIDVKLNREWPIEMDEEHHNGSSQRCNFAKNLDCSPEKKCACKPFFSWNATEKTCVGEEGAFCEMRFWGEAETVGTPTKCAKGLTCIVATHPDTKRNYHVCCYIKKNKHLKSLTYADYHLCEADDTGNDYYVDASVTRDPIEEILDDDYYYDEDEDDESAAGIVKPHRVRFSVSVPFILVVVVILLN